MGTEKLLLFRHTLEKDALVKRIVLYRRQNKPENDHITFSKQKQMKQMVLGASFFSSFFFGGGVDGGVPELS